MGMNSATMPFMFADRKLAARDYNHFIDLTDSIQAGRRNSVFMKFGPASVSSKVVIINRALPVTTIGILTH